MIDENVSTAPKKASKNKLIIFIIILLSIILIAVIISDVYLFNNMKNKNKTKVVVYPAPSGIEGAPDISITVEDEPVFVYDTRVNFNRRF